MTRRVFTLPPLPPEKCAYALARYSRSPDSIEKSLEWVRTHDSRKFLESFYFQYGHASIADLGHVVMCFEGISELAATEIEDEQLWDGQARSSRYQDFSKCGFITPPELTPEEAGIYAEAAGELLAAYKQVHSAMCDWFTARLPRPDSMKPDAYSRNIAARAFDVARYLLFFGVPTGIGQVTSIRTLERQIRTLKASQYAELRALAEEIAQSCAEAPSCRWGDSRADEPVAPTLAKYVDADEHLRQSWCDLRSWAEQNLPAAEKHAWEEVDLCRPGSASSDICATLLYTVTDRPYRQLLELTSAWSAARRNEVIDMALQSRTVRDELQRAFRSAPYVFDIVMDIGAYRDLHRHRRCQQFRQRYSANLGFETPAPLQEAGLELFYAKTVQAGLNTAQRLGRPGSDYLLPWAARSRFLFKMDFAEAEYICRLRTGVKGHFSYRRIAWLMKEKLAEMEPELGRILRATPPWVEDPLTR